MMLRAAFLIAPLFAAALSSAALAAAPTRNASFLDPSSSAPKGDVKASGANTVVADPIQTDAGETLVNVARRVTVFFYNGGRAAAQLNLLTVNADGNVRSKVLSDDCRAIRTLPSQDRCSIVLEVMPTSPGPWSVELLLNHSGQGRIARAEVTGSTLGKTDGKSEGLAVSKKIAAALDFGEVRASEESVARTMLIENDSSENLTISAIDLIESDSGLRLRDKGCKKGDVLKGGESCPITVMWEPQRRGNIATDLIVRHSGNLGFVIVPIRGKAAADVKEAVETGGSGKNKEQSSSLIPQTGGERTASIAGSVLAPPPSMDEIVKSLPQIGSEKLSEKSRDKPDKTGTKETSSSAKSSPAKNDEGKPSSISLIGTVNGRAILGSSDGQTYVIGLGEKTTIDDETVELLQVDATRAVISDAGVRKELALRQAPAVRKAPASKMELEAGASQQNNSLQTPLGTVNNSSLLDAALKGALGGNLNGATPGGSSAPPTSPYGVNNQNGNQPVSAGLNASANPDANSKTTHAVK